MPIHMVLSTCGINICYIDKVWSIYMGYIVIFS